jgi:hypothetical protein
LKIYDQARNLAIAPKNFGHEIIRVKTLGRAFKDSSFKQHRIDANIPGESYSSSAKP